MRTTRIGLAALALFVAVAELVASPPSAHTLTATPQLAPWGTFNYVVGIASRPVEGYWEASADGEVAAFDQADFYGDARKIKLAHPIVGIAATPSGRGYWLVASDGGIFSYGDAHFYGSTGVIHLNRPIVGMTATPSGHGYWFVASDGGIFSFGDARFYGSAGSLRLKQPIVGMAASVSGRGYWFVAADGGMFSYGDARYYGSTGSLALTQPIVGMTATASGHGYWLLANDGAVYTFGDARFYGAAVGRMTGAIGRDGAAGMARAADGAGYYIANRAPFYPVGYGLTLAFGSVAPLVFTNVYEAHVASCTIAANGSGRVTYTVTYANRRTETRAYSWPFEKDDWYRTLQVGGYELAWMFDNVGRTCQTRPLQIKHVLRAGKTAKYVFSGSCEFGAHGWGVDYSVAYTDGSYTGGTVYFDTNDISFGYGTMYVDLGNDKVVSQMWTSSSCG